MSRVAAAANRFVRSLVGLKVVMAVSGAILFGFTIGHMIGNLQVYLGPEKLNAYAAFLHNTPTLLWGTRTLLLISVVAHIATAAKLTRLRGEARPVKYAFRSWRTASYASRTMFWSGIILLLFIVYHLLHFTTGHAHPDFQQGDVYRNFVTGFKVVPVSLFYVAAMVALGLHLSHGAWSLFQSLGATSPRYDKKLRLTMNAVVAVLVAANISFPIAVLAGVIE